MPSVLVPAATVQRSPRITSVEGYSDATATNEIHDRLVVGRSDGNRTQARYCTTEEWQQLKHALAPSKQQRSWLLLRSACEHIWHTIFFMLYFASLLLQDIVKELARTASLAGSSEPAPERQSSGGVAFTAGEVK